MSEAAINEVPVATAKATYLRIAPRKVQIVLDLIRNQPADKAMAILKYTPKAACEPLLKLLKSAMANAENNFDMDVDKLYIAECYVGQGPTLKRIRPRAQGRANRINKKTSHITLVLKELIFPSPIHNFIKGKDYKINESRKYGYDISVYFNVQECEEYEVNQKPG